MVGDIDKEVGFRELFKPILCGHSRNHFSRRGRHVSRKYDDPPHDRLLLKNPQKLSHSFDSDASLIRKEYKNLVGWILSGVCEEIELVSINAASTVCVVLPECDQVHVNLLVRDLVSPIFYKFVDCPIDFP